MSRAPFLRRPPRRDQRSCRLGVEPLEDRRMLNVAPVTVDDLYSTDSNAALTVDATQPGFSSRIYESTPQGSSGGGGSGIDAAQFLGSRFFVDTTLRTGRIGGGIAGNAAAGNGKLFAAVVALSGPDDFPDSADLSTPDVLGHALLTIDASDFKSHLIAAPLDISLTAGWYAVVYGSGKFGATGSGSAPDTGTGGHEQLRTTNGAAWTSQTDRTTHFFLDGQALFVGVLANDSDADGDAFTASLVDDVQNGSLQFDADGTFTYTPDLDFVGADTFTYQANDGTSDSNLATVTINVVGVNLPPEANDDTYSVDEDIVLDVDVAAGVLDNDVDVNGDVLFSELFSGPSDGTLQLNLDGSFSYTPNENFFGTDTFTYRVSDGATVSEVATVVITINSVDDPPVAVDDLFSTELNTTLVVSVLEPEFGARIYESTQQGASGGGGGSNIDAAQFLASRFFVDATIRTGRIGGEIGGNSAAGNGMLFAAIVALSGPDDLPDSVDLSTPDVVGHALLPLDTSDIFGDLIAAPLDIELARGWYAMVYGSGKFGATGSGYAPATGSGGHELLTMWQGRWISQTNHASHFFLDGEAIPAGVLANDSDAEGEPLTASLVDDVQNGTLQFNADGTFTYTPNQDFVGTDTFTYQANDGAVNSSLATVTLNVVDVNLPPTASDNAYRVDEDNLLEVDAAAGVLDNDVDANGDVLTATLVSGPDQGTLQLNPDGSFSYTPESDFFGEDSFTYVANDGELDSEPATVTITVDPVQDAPVAIDDAYEVNEDTTTNLLAPSDGLVHHWTFDETSGDVLSDSAGELNGSLVNWGASEETWVEGVVGGALDMGDADNHVLLDGSIGSGDTYTISVWSRLDQTGALNPRILGWLLQNTEIAGGVGIYFKYQSGQAYSPSDPVVGQWEHYALTTDRISGAATIYRDGVAVGTGTFRPDRPDGRPWLIGHHINPGYHGASWQGALDDLRVYDRVLSAQEVQNMYLAVTTGSALGVLLNDSDADGDALTAAVVDEPEHGDLAFNLDGTFTYTPDAEFSGTDSFTYRANDGTEDSNLAVAAIIVNPVNDAPLADDDPGYVVDEDGQLVVIAADGVLANDSDVDSDTLTASLVSSVSHGTLVLGANGSFTYMPEADFFGQDTFTYRANDGEDISNLATVTITVNSQPDAPVAVDDLVTMFEDTVVSSGGLLPELDLVEWSANGHFYALVREQVRWEDARDAAAAMNYRGAIGHLATISSLQEQTFLNQNVLNTITGEVFIGLTDEVAEGDFRWVTGEPFDFTYWRGGEPNNANNDDYVELQSSFGWRWNDESINKQNLGYIVEFEPPFADNLLLNDTDVDGDPLTVILDENNTVEHGVLDLNDDGTFTYTPEADFFGSDTFSYRASDGVLQSELATVTITVAPVNDAPTADDDGGYELDEDGELIVGADAGVLVGDIDSEGDPLTARLVEDASHGTLALAEDGSFTYTPDEDFFGEDSFTYVANDGESDSNVATVTIDVNAVQDAPVTVDDKYVADEDTAFPPPVEIPPGLTLVEWPENGNFY
ncbi:MAG: tandem-95 repeat protein, partial [Planctomycetes bacterium]|nr:tandem-95 repeat protein [Planctomycetota bacterium]